MDEAFFKDGKIFDGSSIAGWKGINESDMILMPELAAAVIDPFYQETTVNLRCDVVEPMTMQGYERDPRSLAKRAAPAHDDASDRSGDELQSVSPHRTQDPLAVRSRRRQPSISI